jgi:hypothetical protein
MYKYKIIFSLLISMSMTLAAYGQEKPEIHPVSTITGTVLSTDAVGNIISIRTDDQRQMAFVVPNKAIITQETHSIGLMDIGKSDSVTIQYLASSSKNTVVNIVDNESVVNE